jgi:hypothetical protein
VCSDGKQPNVTEYTLTLPYHVCTAWGQQCVKACGSDNQCAGDCLQKHPCGAQQPTRVNETASSTTVAPTASATQANQEFNGFADSAGAANSDDDKSAAGALRLGDSYGLAVVAGGLFAGFAMLL